MSEEIKDKVKQIISRRANAKDNFCAVYLQETGASINDVELVEQQTTDEYKLQTVWFMRMRRPLDAYMVGDRCKSCHGFSRVIPMGPIANDVLEALYTEADVAKMIEEAIKTLQEAQVGGRPDDE